MELRAGGDRLRTVGWTLLSAIPVTVLAIAAVGGYTAANGLEYANYVNVTGWAYPFNPFNYVANIFFHAGGWSHYAGNMRLWLPFGAVLTWLTSERHVLLVVAVTNALTVAVAILIEGLGIGLSHVVFAVVAAALVRSTGYALENASTEVRQFAVAGVFVPSLVGFLLIMLLAGPRWVADFYHFLGFLFGGAVEAMYVLGEADGEEREIPRHVGR